jgi:hypothetical protein
MGPISGAVGSELGSGIAGLIGRRVAGRKGGEIASRIGRVAGGVVGGALPMFKKGGKVNKTGLAVVHKGEYVLPAGVKPTKAQKAKVAKKKAGRK